MIRTISVLHLKSLKNGTLAGKLTISLAPKLKEIGTRPLCRRVPCPPINPKEDGFFRKKFWQAPNINKKIKILKFPT